MPERTGWQSIVVGSIEKEAPDLAALLREQAARDQTTINLIASECYAPRACLEAEASLLANKNASGYPARHSIGDSTILDEVEQLAIDRAKTLFGAEHANVQAYSATIANVAVLRALLDKGDRILTFDKTVGGHFSHGSDQHIAGQDYEARFFAIDETDGALDFESADRIAREFRPRMIIAGSSNYPRQIDFQALHEIAQRVGAMLFADIAHVAGLIVAGLHPNPVPFADVVTTSTHKTLCGPRAGGLILSKCPRPSMPRRSMPRLTPDCRIRRQPTLLLAVRRCSRLSQSPSSATLWKQWWPMRTLSQRRCATGEFVFIPVEPTRIWWWSICAGRIGTGQI